MSSMNKNLPNNAEASTSSYHQGLQDNQPDMMLLAPPSINWRPNNTPSQNNNYAFMKYIDNPRVQMFKLNVKGFKLKEICAKIKNGFIMIRGRQEKKKDKHGFSSKMFSRKYYIPKNIIKDEIRAYLISDRLLLFTGRKRPEILEINIRQTNLPASTQTMDQTALGQLNHPKPKMSNRGIVTVMGTENSRQYCRHRRFTSQRPSVVLQQWQRSIPNRNKKIYYFRK